MPLTKSSDSFNILKPKVSFLLNSNLNSPLCLLIITPILLVS
ncbi:hypothetical protein [Campylobacter phage CJLB-10]|nr:hypothetical protein [Campylobacter phage CJLB-10]